MRLEALDRLTPNLICVATIEKIDEKTGKILIHFDGWTNRYDYWTEFETPDLHPVGYMEENGHSLGTKNPQLQAPKGYTKQFTWETYCKEIGHLPVPYHLFSETQCDGTPRDRTDSVYDACDAGMVNQGMTENQGTLTASCKSDSNEASSMISAQYICYRVVKYTDCLSHQ
ncbi:hypothetical protein FSP39_003478 [Pinctada imbricata]|uniref:Uncharacterized protein n=1 Tax=Pinctada imbricata TaxID=66713 RepID=A0AA88Y2H2_PINIB|nr:hypothetical protein FSP39_003478 [Pinctada imbricata]